MYLLYIVKIVEKYCRTVDGEIRIIANVPNDNVVVEIPYGRLRLNEVVNFGMAMYVYFPERHKAIKQLRGLRRQPAELPFPDENAGAVIGRLASATGLSASYQFFGTPCVVNTPSFGQSRLAFGNNDYRYLNAKELGSGAWRISVVWIPEAPVGRCTSDSSTLELIDSTLSAIGNNP